MRGNSYLEWFEKQPKEISSHITFFLTGMLPGRTLDKVDPLAPAQVVVDIVKEAVQDHPPRDAGMALSLVALTDFIFMGRATKEDWIKADEFHQKVIGTVKQMGNESFAEKLEDSAEKMEFRAAQWIKSSGDWKTVKEGYLTHDIVAVWMREAIKVKSDEQRGRLS